MIVSIAGKKPNVHPTCYVSPAATIAGDVTIAAGCAILPGATIVGEGAAVTIGADTVVMEQAVLRASGGSALRFPLSIGARCIVGPHTYVVGATVGDGCFVASGSKVFNGAVLDRDSGVALNGIVHVNAHLTESSTVPMNHIAFGDPATIYPPDQAPEIAKRLRFYETVFNLEAGPGVRARAAKAYAKFLRKTHARDAVVPQTTGQAPRRSGDEPPPTQTAEVDKVVDVMMLELEEMEHRRQEAIRRQKKSPRSS